LKYVSDTFEERHAELVATEYPEDAEDRDFYDAEISFGCLRMHVGLSLLRQPKRQMSEPPLMLP
jgi:predicted ATPase